jgi:hypothetical protein
LPAGKGSGLIFFRNIRNRVSELPGYEKFETDHKECKGGRLGHQGLRKARYLYDIKPKIFIK